MLFPGLKKLRNQFGFQDNGHCVYGFRQNSFVMFADGQGMKVLSFFFPVELDADDVAKVKSWYRKGYATELAAEVGDYNVSMEFKEVFLPYKTSRMAEIITDLTDYVANKYPDAPRRCLGRDCDGQPDGDLQIFEIDGVPTPLCAACAKRYQVAVDEVNSAFEEQPNNYEQGALAAAAFSVPGILLSLLLYALGRLSSVTGLVYLYLAMKGYTWARGKMNKVGVCIIALISLAFSALGTYVGFVFQLVRQFSEQEQLADSSLGERVSYALELVEDPEVHSILVRDEIMTLFLCVVGIAYYFYLMFRSAGKASVKKL